MIERENWQRYFDGERRLPLATRRAVELFGQTLAVGDGGRWRRWRRRRRRRRRRRGQKRRVPVQTGHFQAAPTNATS